MKSTSRDVLERLNLQKSIKKVTDSTESDTNENMDSSTDPLVKPEVFRQKDSEEETADVSNLEAGDSGLPSVSHIQKIADTVRAQTQAEFEAERSEFAALLEEAKQKQDELRSKLEEERENASKIADKARTEQEILLSTFYSGGGKLPVSVMAGQGLDSAPGTPYIVGGTMSKFRAQDLLKAYEKETENCPSFVTLTPTGNTVVQKDYRQADSFYKEHRQALLSAVQDNLKKSGFLRGGVSSASRDNTTPADLPYAFLDLASAEIRLTHHEETIWWQFARRVNDPSINVEQAGRFPRLEFGTYSDDPGDYELGSSISSLNALTEPLRANSVPIEIKEYGIGKPGTNLRPIAVHEVVTSNNIFDALAAINSRLGKSYYRFEDLQIRRLIQSTTRGGYVSNDTLVETAGEVVAGGQITQKFLAYLYGYMSALSIPKLPDGCFFLALPPQSMAVLRQDIIERQRFIAAPDFAGLVSLMQEYHGDANLKRNSGYQGKIEGFHVFQSNSHGTGIPGTEGVATVTLNGTSVTVRNCYAFGADAVGVLESMPFTIRQRSENSFGRNTEFIWLAHQGYGGLDIDPLRPNGSSSEQLRVLDLRCSDVAV